jgi:hypothetical protein
MNLLKACRYETMKSSTLVIYVLQHDGRICPEYNIVELPVEFWIMKFTIPSGVLVYSE